VPEGARRATHRFSDASKCGWLRQRGKRRKVDSPNADAIPNRGSGIRISGRAHGNAIGGFQPWVEPHVNNSSNGGYGIAIVDAVKDNVVFHTYIGTNTQGTAALGNGLGGVFLGPGTWSSTIGGTPAAAQNKINHSLGSGGNENEICPYGVATGNRDDHSSGDTITNFTDN
jgi:hypothetical protein